MSLPAVLAFGAVLLAFSPLAIAQRHGGGGAPTSGSGLEGYSGIASGVDEKDELKNFHDALAVQATSQQSEQFLALLKSTEAARSALKSFLQVSGKSGPSDLSAKDLAPKNTALGALLDKARSDNRNFLDGFSIKQKAGLKDTTRNLLKVDSDVLQFKGRLDQILQAGQPVSADVALNVDSLDKALATFYVQQLSLGREMGIDAANPLQSTFSLPRTKTTARIGRQPIGVGVSGALSQTAYENGQHTFGLMLSANLGDLQQNMGQILRAELNRSDTCGQRIDIRSATLLPVPPASVVSLRLHFERWTCYRMSGQATANEIAEGDGEIEIKLTPVVESNALKLTAMFGRVDANGMLGEAIRSGSLGDDLRDAASHSVLSAITAGTDFNVTLPPVARTSANLQGARFEDAGAGVLNVVLNGQVQLSDEQTTLMASQLKSTLSAQGSAP